MQKRILFVYTHFSTFVRTDYEILSEVHKVTKYQYKSGKGVLKNAAAFIRQFIFLLFNIWRFDAVFIWFADYHSFLPVLFAKLTGKKSVVVVGGYDVARIPELNYGVFITKLRGCCAAFSMRNSSMNISVSKYVDRKVRRVAPKNKTTLVYNCVNLKDYQSVIFEKENLVITVGLIETKRSFYLKGIDTFVETARLLPDYKFIIIGINENVAKYEIKNYPENLEIIGQVKHEQLAAIYKKAKIYCQFSRSESFGVAIVEAMYFGCIPVVTNVGGMPEIVGEKKRIVQRVPQTISKHIEHILFTIYQPVFQRENFIHDSFSLNSRRKNLLMILDS
jgi:glycosyltransferase involved in cell wall biosynthesis